MPPTIIRFDMKRFMVVIVSALGALPIHAQSRKNFCEIKGIGEKLSVGLKSQTFFANHQILQTSIIRRTHII